MSAAIRPLRSEELPQVLDLLERLKLPIAGVREHQDTFLVATEDGRFLGAVGLEVYERVGLLRSLAVEPVEQGRGLGARLVRSALSTARDKKLGTLYLLTTTAVRFFPRFGFERISRNELDPLLSPSAELQGACPQSAVCMKLELADSSRHAG